MTTLQQTAANQKRVTQLKVAVAAVLGEVLQRGFHGSGTIEVTVQDGTIQAVRRCIEQVER